MRSRRPSGAVTYAEAKAAVRYDPITGKFWSLSTGEEVGYVNCQKSRYITVEIRGARVRASRLAWLLMTGEWPAEAVDHINGARGDNRWSNLRSCTPMQNMRNRRMSSNNTSGFTGASWHKNIRRWVAKIKVAGRMVHLGSFKTLEEAASAYAAGAVERHGEFAPDRIRSIALDAAEKAPA